METNEQSFREYEAIEKALKSYIDSAKTADGSPFAKDWLESFRLVGTLEGNTLNLSREDVMNIVDGMEGSPDVESRIAWINYQGNAAAARLEFLNWAGYRYTDFFLLSKIDGEWKVASKVFDAHDKN